MDLVQLDGPHQLEVKLLASQQTTRAITKAESGASSATAAPAEETPKVPPPSEAQWVRTLRAVFVVGFLWFVMLTWVIQYILIQSRTDSAMTSI